MLQYQHIFLSIYSFCLLVRETSSSISVYPLPKLLFLSIDTSYWNEESYMEYAFIPRKSVTIQWDIILVVFCVLEVF